MSKKLGIVMKDGNNSVIKKVYEADTINTLLENKAELNNLGNVSTVPSIPALTKANVGTIFNFNQASNQTLGLVKDTRYIIVGKPSLEYVQLTEGGIEYVDGGGRTIKGQNEGSHILFAPNATVGADITNDELLILQLNTDVAKPDNKIEIELSTSDDINLRYMLFKIGSLEYKLLASGKLELSDGTVTTHTFDEMIKKLDTLV